MYAVLDEEGDLVDVEGSLHAAESSASRVAGRGRNFYVDAPERHYRPNEELIDIRPSNIPMKAFKLTRLNDGNPVTWADVGAVSKGFNDFTHVHRVLKPYFPPIEVYSTPVLMAKAFIGQNYKTSKEVEGFAGKVMGLSLAPYWKATDPMASVETPPRGAANLCAGSNPECRKACLVTTGRNIGYAVGIKYNRTRALMNHPVEFCSMLAWSMQKFFARALNQDFRSFVRLNVYSDIPWEIFFPDLFRAFPAVQVYDYTKVERRTGPSNYDLTFSYSGTNEKQALRELDRGRRVAVVFLRKRMMKGKKRVFVPFVKGATFWGHRVVDGDISDLRPLDPAPSIVGLGYKTPKEEHIDVKDLGAFVVPVQEIEGQLVAPHSARQSHAAEFEEAGLPRGSA